MTNEIYEKIVSQINSMSDSEYQNLLSQAKEMDNDFNAVIESLLAKEIENSNVDIATVFSSSDEHITGKTQVLDGESHSSMCDTFKEPECVKSQYSTYEDFECLAA